MLIKNKSIIYFLLISFVPLVILSIFSINASRNALEDAIGNDIRNLSVEKAGAMAQIINERINEAILISEIHDLKELIENANLAYQGKTDEEIQEAIDQIDKEWISSKGNTKKARNILNSDLSVHLRELQQNNPDKFGEIFLTDIRGTNLAMTGITTDYYQADEWWWEVTFDKGMGRVLVEDRGYDESARSIVLGIGVPVKSEGKVIGVLKIHYKIISIINIVLATHSEKAGITGKLINSNEETIAYGKKDDYTEISDTEKTILSANKAGWIEGVNKNGGTILGYAPVKNVNILKRARRTGSVRGVKGEGWEPTTWYMVIHKDKGKAFLPIDKITNTILLYVLLTVLIAVALAVYFARSISNPLQRLIEGSAIISGGNLAHKVGTDEQDEIGQLSRAFDQMTQGLKSEVASLRRTNKSLTDQIERSVDSAGKTFSMFDTDILLESKIQERTGEFEIANKKRLEALSFAEQMRLLYGQIPKTILSGLFASSLFCMTFWDVIDRFYIVTWFVIIASVYVLRGVIYLAFRAKNLKVDQYQIWGNLYVLFNILAGSAWGAASLFMFATDNPTYQLIVIIWLMGVTSAGVSAYSVHIKAMIAFFIPTIAPLAICLFYIGGTLHILLGIALCVYSVIVITSILPINKSMINAIKLNFKLKMEIGERKQAEEALKETEEKYRDLFENANDIFFTTDLEGKFTSVNMAALNTLKYRRDELLGKNYSAVLPPELMEKTKEMTQRKLDGEEQTSYELEFIDKDSRRIPIEINTRLIIKDGEPVGIQGAARDITERKKSEDSLKMLKSALDQTSEMVAITNSEGVVEYTNRAIERITGYSSEELIGVNPRIFQSGKHEAGFYKNMWDTIKAGNIWSDEIINKNKSGELAEEEMTISPIKDNKDNITHFLAIKRDISERKRAENKLKKAKDVAEDATKIKDKFVSLVAHDMRGPLGAARSILQLAEKEKNADGLYGGGIEEHLKHSISSLTGLLDMIDKLLDISRLQSGQITLQKRFHFAWYIAETCVQKINLTAQTKGVEVVNEVDAKQKLLVDDTLFGETIMNLMSNAIKFTPRGGVVTVFSPSDLSVAVKDNGIGIAQNIEKDIFRHDIKTSTKGTEGEKGTGLGLPLCKDIMDAHKGEIKFETHEEGMTFTLEFPSVRPTVVVADDQEVHLITIKEQLEKIANVEVVLAENGEDAFKLAKELEPVLVITDLHMPIMDGFELIRKLREEQKTSHIPIVVNSALSSSASPSDGGTIDARSHAFELGANDFIAKPIVPDDFVPRVLKYLP